MSEIALWNPVGHQQITSLGSATALTVPAGAKRALITPETQAVRWRDDGTDPTGSIGMPLAVAATMDYRGNLAAIKFIEQAASAKINVAYFA